MLFAEDVFTTFLGTCVLLALSIYTILRCRSDEIKSSDYESFLFSAKSRRYSLASSLGAAFSVTYLGATVIYGHIFKAWYLVTLAIAVLSAGIIINAIIGCAHREIPDLESRHSNLLLDLLALKMRPADFHILICLYAAIYFLLLVEELAVSRLVLATLFPEHPLISSTLLATVCLVILAYLNQGGFRALLVSDYEQLKLILPFVIALAFIIYKKNSLPSHAGLFRLNGETGPYPLLLAVVFLIAWLVAAVDFYSRLNFVATPDSPIAEQQKSFACLTLLLAFCLFSLGGFFGSSLPSAFMHKESPSGFAEFGVEYVLSEGSKATSVIFFASLFCMIFTTLNTLLFTLVQISYYNDSNPGHIRSMPKVLMAAVVLSCVLWLDCVSAFGIFIGSLMVIPLFPIAKALLPAAAPLFPATDRYLIFALISSALLFVAGYRHLETSFERHFWIPGIVVVGTLVCLVLAKISDALREGRLRNGKSQDL